MTHPIAKSRYILLTTFRRDGSPVGTPVWVAPLQDELVVITLADAWKVRRLRANPAVSVQPCDVRGKVDPGAPTYSGTGRVSETPGEVAAVRNAMNRKYALARVGNTLELILGKWMGRKPRAGIYLTLEESPVGELPMQN
jgi:hypothetical protein